LCYNKKWRKSNYVYTFKLSRYENIGLNSRSRLDLSMANGSYDDSNIITYLSSGNIGIGITNPFTKLDINGTTLNRNGNSVDSSSLNQILFSWFGTGSIGSKDYCHSIKSRHDSGANNRNNSIDFYLWQTSDAASAIGTKHAMSITSAGIGIGVTNPTSNYRLECRGPAYFIANVSAIPSSGALGSDGLAIMINPGASSIASMAIGYGPNILWYNTPSSSKHIFYIAGSSLLDINSTGATLSGSLTSSNLIASNLTTTNLTGTGLIQTSSNIITTGTGSITSATTINATTNLQEGGTNLTAKYLQISGGQLTGTLGIGTTNSAQNQIFISTSNSTSSNQLLIRSTSNFANIQFNNGVPASNAFIGLGCSNITGNYTCNLFLETNNSIILNAGGVNASANVPEMIIHSNGNVGIGTTNPLQKMHISGTTPAILRIETNFSAPDQISGIEFGIPAFRSAGSAKITSTAISGNKANLQFFTCTGALDPLVNTLAMTIDEAQNIGIGTNAPSAKLDVRGIIQTNSNVFVSGNINANGFQEI